LPLFVDSSKDGQAIEAGAAEIGFPCYFRIHKKNLTGKPGFFEKSRMGKSGFRKIGSLNKFRLSEVRPAGKFSPVKIGKFLEFLTRERNGSGKIYFPKIEVIFG
jgi:hypothetical protein